MAVDMGSAQGSLTLNANEFFASIQSSVQEIHNLYSAAQEASSGVDSLESSLSAAGGAGAGLSGAMSGVTDAAATATSGVEDVGEAAEEAGSNTQTFRERMSSAWQSMRDALPTTEELITKLDTFGNKAVAVGKDLTKYITTPLAGIGVYSVKTSMSFEKAMSQVAATMGVSIDDIQDLTEAAKKMGEETQFTNIEAAQALNYLALAGYNSEQMIAALPNVLNLAAAGGMDLAKASDMLTDGLSALNLASKDSETLMGNMSTMVDQMARTASRSNTSVAQLGDAILTVGGTASYLHDGLSETNQVIGLLADRGIKASEAGTHLRNIILAMQPATDDAKQAFLDVGLATKDADGNFVNLAYNADGTMKSLQEIFQILQEGTSTMSDMEKQQVLSDIFHRTDLASANALLGTSQERWQELADEIDNAAGAGSQMAATQLNNLSGQLTLLKSKIDSVATSIGETLAPRLSELLDKVSELLDKFKDLDPKTQKVIVDIGLIAAAIGPVVTVLGKISIAASGVIKALQTLGTVLGALKGSAVVAKIASAFSSLPSLVSSAISSLGTTVSSGIAALGAPVTAGLSTLIAVLIGFLAGYGIGTLIYNAIGDEIDEVLYPIFDGVVEAWGVVVKFFTETIPDAFNTCVEFITGVASEVADNFNTIVTSVSDFFVTIWESIVSMAETVADFFSGIASWVDEHVIQPVLSVVVPIVSKIGEIIAKIFEIIITLLGVLASWIYNNVITPIINFVSNGVQTIINTIQGAWNSIVNTVLSFVNSALSVIQSLWDGITNTWNKLSSWVDEHILSPVSDGIAWLTEFITDKFQWAWDGITAVFGTLADFFSKAWETIQSTYSTVDTWFRDIFQKARDSIEEVFSGVTDFFSGVWDSIQTMFNTAAETISQAFSDAFDTAFNSAMEGVESVVNFFVDSINSAIDTINEIPGVDIEKLDRLSLPRLAVGLDYVPYDDYQAILHKGERVLTAEENEEYSQGRYSGGDTYIFNSPEPIDERTAAQEMKRAKQDLAEGF